MVYITSYIDLTREVLKRQWKNHTPDSYKAEQEIQTVIANSDFMLFIVKNIDQVIIANDYYRVFNDETGLILSTYQVLVPSKNEALTNKNDLIKMKDLMETERLDYGFISNYPVEASSLSPESKVKCVIDMTDKSMNPNMGKIIDNADQVEFVCQTLNQVNEALMFMKDAQCDTYFTFMSNLWNEDEDLNEMMKVAKINNFDYYFADITHVKKASNYKMF